MIRRFLTLCTFLLLVAAATPAFALDLAGAKTQGLVGEQVDGLIGIVDPPGTAEVQALVRSVNDGRMESYRDIAAKQGAPVESVRSLAGKTLIEKTPPGQYVRLPSGQWSRK